MNEMEPPTPMTSKFRIPEIVVFLLFFGIMLNEPIGSNFMMYRTCYTILGFNESDCAKLGSQWADNSTAELERKVQPYANVIGMVLVWPAQVVPAILCLFVGPWSDRRGRKPVLISTFVGFTLGSISSLIITLISSLSPWYTIIPNVILVMFGGFSPTVMLLVCYVTDITTNENRGVRLGIFEAVFGIASLLGTLSSSPLFDLVGYPGVYATSSCCYFLALLYLIFVLPETIPRSNNEDTRNVIALRNVKDMFKALLKRRAYHVRTIILIGIAMMMLYIMTGADSNIMFYYLRGKFQWDLRKYTTFKSIRDSVLMVGSFVGLMVMHKWLKFHEMTIVLISTVLLCNSSVMQAFADTDWHIFFAASLRLISGIFSPMVRSYVSKLIPPDEVGKIFSMALTLETFAMMVGAPAYTFLYNSTLSYFPGAFNLLSASIYFVLIVLTVIVIILKRKLLNPPYEYLVDERTD